MMMLCSRAVLLACLLYAATAFSPKHNPSAGRSALRAAPKRLPDNVDGVVFVNEKCINCSACSNFAPMNFARHGSHHVVYKQPSTNDEIQASRAALAACPVAAIRVDNQGEELAKEMALKNDRGLPFPRLLTDNVWYVGYHNERSFGAVPYLTFVEKDNGEKVWVMIDTPRYGKLAVDAVTSLTGPDGPQYLVLTHVDDTADHGKWKAKFPNLRRIFHSGDLGRHNWIGDHTLEQVEVLLRPSSGSGGMDAFDLEGNLLAHDTTTQDAVLWHTPGHSPGSITLHIPSRNIIFTGDTLGFTTSTGTLTGFPRYGNDLTQQETTLEHLGELEWDLVAPGHGHVRNYKSLPVDSKKQELTDAIKELRQW